jgi:C-terminal processing protease CtpA/Prc
MSNSSIEVATRMDTVPLLVLPLMHAGLHVEPITERDGAPGGIFVTEVVAGGAAEESGQLRPHDRIVSVNDVPIVGLPNES